MALVEPSVFRAVDAFPTATFESTGCSSAATSPPAAYDSGADSTCSPFVGESDALASKGSLGARLPARSTTTRGREVLANTDWNVVPDAPTSACREAAGVGFADMDPILTPVVLHVVCHEFHRGRWIRAEGNC
jgi:hypothetical protein